MNRLVLLTATLFLFSGCANPLNQVTSDRYGSLCSEFQEAGQLEKAEQACYRALVNVDWGNLGEVQKSVRMYNLAQVKRQLQKWEEAEELYLESMKIEEKLNTPANPIKMGRRYTEISALYYDMKRYDLALHYVPKLFPLAEMYRGKERKFIAKIFHFYSIETKKRGNINLAKELEEQRNKLGFKASDIDQTIQQK